jgi:hypothetical protein
MSQFGTCVKSAENARMRRPHRFLCSKSEHWRAPSLPDNSKINSNFIDPWSGSIVAVKCGTAAGDALPGGPAAKGFHAED